MGLKRKCDFIIFFSKYSTLPPSGGATCENTTRPFFHECSIACGTTCDKVPVAKMITVKDLIIISHSYSFFYEKWNACETPPLRVEYNTFTICDMGRGLSDCMMSFLLEQIIYIILKLLSCT